MPFVLCYVEGDWAYFTSQPLDEAWGDDWNDAPYEHNAGLPYAWRHGDSRPEWTIAKVAFDVDCMRPCDTGGSWTVEKINAGAVAWLTPTGEGKPIHAGVTLDSFRRAIDLLGGTVYLPSPL